MDPQINMQELREKIINELNLGHLNAEEQSQIIDQLGAMLVERATMVLLSKVPPEEVEKVDTLLANNQQQEAQALIEMHVPNAQEIMMRAVQDGIEEHKRRVAEMATKDVSVGNVPTI